MLEAHKSQVSHLKTCSKAVALSTCLTLHSPLLITTAQNHLIPKIRPTTLELKKKYNTKSKEVLRCPPSSTTVTLSLLCENARVASRGAWVGG